MVEDEAGEEGSERVERGRGRRERWELRNGNERVRWKINKFKAKGRK